jgi:hypothetical protein
MDLVPKEMIFVSIAKGRINSLFVYRPFHSRANAVMGLLVETLSGIKAPDRRLLINIGDRPRRERLLPPWTVYGPAQTNGFPDIAAPDFVFGGWPEAGILDFDATCAEMTAAGASEPETPLLGWYGNTNNVPARHKLLALAKQHLDSIHAIDVGDWHKRGDRPGVSLPNMPAQVRKFRFLIDIEGVGYSGRLKLLLHSGRPVFIQERPWREWFFSDLQPWEHYVPVDRDLSNLIANLERLRADPALERRIGESGRAFAKRFLTREAAIGVWRRLLLTPR